MESHPADESFAHQMHMYQQQQQHEVHIQHQQQQQQQQQQMLQQQKSIHNQRASTTVHHRPASSPQQQQHQQQQQQQTQSQQQPLLLLQAHQHSHIPRAQQIAHHINAHLGANHQNTRHSINNQQNNLTQHNQTNRHNRNNLTPQTRPISGANNSPFQQQRFQGNQGPPPQMHQQTMMPPTNMHHHHHHHLQQQQQQHVGAGFGQLRQGVQENDFPLRILVQSDMVGAIIGRSGSTIKQITQQTKARIDVHREESLEQHEKVITINGSPESCSAACFKIMEVILYERYQLNKDGGSSNFDDQSAKIDYENQEIQLRILAHNNLIGRLIGRKGASIKQIMEQTSTKINISVNSFTDCTHERTITILGNLDQVRLAEQIVSAKLRTAYMSDVSVTLQAMNQQSYFHNVPLSYMPGPYAQNPLLSSLVNSQVGHGGSHSLARAMPVGTHQNSIPGPQLYPNTTSYLPVYPNMSSNPSGPIFGFNQALGLDQERETVNIYIPNTMVGAIIGKSGSAIKEMINSSGASIKVAAAPSEPFPNNVATLKDENLPATLEQQPTVNSDSINEPTKTNDTPENLTQDSSHTPSVTSPQSGPRQHSNAPDNYHTTRKVTIIGSPEAQWSAQYLIYRKVSIENGKSDISLMVEIQVPSQLVGKIIGKGGMAVKQLQKQTRTTIRLPADDRTSSTENIEKENETCVLITGEFPCSQLAQRHIRNLIRESLHSAMRQNKPPYLNSKQSENPSKPDSQTETMENHQTRSDNESTSTPDEPDESISSNEKNTRENSKHLNGEQQQASNESPSSSGELDRPYEDKSQSTSSQESTADAGGEQADNNQTHNNNNTINKNLNSTEKGVTNKQSPSNELNDHTGDDMENNDQRCPVENGTDTISTSSAKRKPIIDSAGNQPALVNNGNPN